MAKSSQRHTLKYIATTAVGINEDQVGIINDTTAAAVAYAVENASPGQVERDVLIFSLAWWISRHLACGRLIQLCCCEGGLW